MKQVVLFLTILTLPASLFAQGPLSPTAAPAPTMKSLAQIEPRIAITNLPYTISSSGSYYVTTNLTCTTCSGVQPGINFSLIPLADNVTLDLNGFTLSGMAGSGHGINVSGGYNYVIRNGTLANWGEDGVDMSLASNSRFENLQFYGNGHIGLEAGAGSVVVNCEATANTVAGYSLLSGEICHCVAVGNGTGIVASAGCLVADCTASGNTSDGINVGVGTGVRGCTSYQNGNNGVTTSTNCTLIGCTAGGNTANGISVGNGCAVKDCTASGNKQYGIEVGNNCTVKDCSASSNVGAGIYVSSNDCLIAGNTCNGNGSTGIAITGGQNRVDGNHVAASGNYGIYPNNANVANSITRNSAAGNGIAGYGNYSGNADYAPTGSVSTATNPWTNF
jgi:parallel beta-helix repeat protein